MSSEIAFREGTPCVPGTPDNRTVLRTEIAEIAARLKIAERLEGYGQTLDVIEHDDLAGMKYFVLSLDAKAKELTVNGHKQLASATDMYDSLERTVGADPNIDVVMVQVDSVTALKRAYPNYFLDTATFLSILAEAVDGTP